MEKEIKGEEVLSHKPKVTVTLTKAEIEARKEEEVKFELELKDLNLLASKVKFDPNGFNEELIKIIEKYSNCYNNFKKNPTKRSYDLAKYTIFMANIFEFYSVDLKFLIGSLSSLLESYSAQMHYFNRKKTLQALVIISKKGFWKPLESIKFFSQILLLEDKILRQTSADHMYSVIKKNDMGGRNSSLHKQLADYFQECISEGEDELAKRMLKIMVQLFEKGVWRDKRIVNIMASGALHTFNKVVNISCQFLIETTKADDDLESSSSEEDLYMNSIYNNKHTKKTKKRAGKLEKEKKKHTRRLNRIQALKGSSNFYPIDSLYNPQTFTDQLFSKLRKSKYTFGSKLHMMAVVSRMIGRHRLIIPSFYGFLQKYLKYGNKELGRIFAFLAEATHTIVPDSDLEPILKFIILHFANESCPDLKIAMGLNCITQMCARKPLLISEEDLNFLCSLRGYKEKNVTTAVKTLINLYRDLNPLMLKKQYRGKMEKDDLTKDLLGKRNYLFGEDEVQHRVDGAELLGEDGENDIETERFLTDEDFRRIRKLKRKALYRKQLEKYAPQELGEKSMQKPEFDILAHRGKLQFLTGKINKGEEVDDEEFQLKDSEDVNNLEEWQRKVDEFAEDEDSSAEEDMGMNEIPLSKAAQRNDVFLEKDDMIHFVNSKQKKREIARQEAKKKERVNTFADKLKNRAKMTNYTKKRNKPYLMTQDKLRNKVVDLYESMRKTKNQIGKVTNRGLKNKFSNKKAGLKMRK